MFPLDDEVSTEARFWICRHNWPNSTKDHVFLAEAIEAVARSYFGEEWTGEEPTTPELIQLSKQHLQGVAAHLGRRILTERMQKEAVRLLENEGHKVEWVEKSRLTPLSTVHKSTSGGPIIRKAPILTVSDWEKAFEIAELKNTHRREARNRFVKVKMLVTDALRDEKLVSVMRPTEGGAYSEPLHWSVWNSEQSRLTSRFNNCQINPIDPFGYGHAGKDFRWIFVQRKGLEEFLEASAPKIQKKQIPNDKANDFAAEIIKAATDNGARITQTEFNSKLLERFPEMNREQYRKMWANHKPDEWGRGRPKQS